MVRPLERFKGVTRLDQFAKHELHYQQRMAKPGNSNTPMSVHTRSRLLQLHPVTQTDSQVFLGKDHDWRCHRRDR